MSRRKSRDSFRVKADVPEDVQQLVSAIKAERVRIYADEVAHGEPIHWLPWAGEEGATCVRDIT